MKSDKDEFEDLEALLGKIERAHAVAEGVLLDTDTSRPQNQNRELSVDKSTFERSVEEMESAVQVLVDLHDQAAVVAHELDKHKRSLRGSGLM